MSEGKHTPGPWGVADIYDGSGYGINGANGEAVVWWAGPDEAENGIERKQDAHLIAAAPELLEALVRLVSLGDNHSPFGGEIYLDRVDYAWDEARAAIAKARGQS